jgi:hypothetical protein
MDFYCHITGGNITLRSKVLPEDRMMARLVRNTSGFHYLAHKMSLDSVLNTILTTPSNSYED